jgi:hypothetical protein
MATETPTRTPEAWKDPRELALLKAIGLDRVAPEQRELALNIAQRYELDLMLKHLVLIDGRPFITRDGLLHIAHRSGQLDGIETSEPIEVEGYWRATCSVYRKDMSRAFTYSGRYPVKGKNAAFGPEMAVKVAESMALRRAFDVAAPAADERWDTDVPTVEPTAPRQTLAEVAAATRQRVVEPEPVDEAESVPAWPEDGKGGPLTAREFKERLGKSPISVDTASRLFHETYPDKETMASLTDEERGFFWLVLTA